MLPLNILISKPIPKTDILSVTFILFGLNTTLTSTDCIGVAEQEFVQANCEVPGWTTVSHRPLSPIVCHIARGRAIFSLTLNPSPMPKPASLSRNLQSEACNPTRIHSLHEAKSSVLSLAATDEYIFSGNQNEDISVGLVFFKSSPLC